MIPVGSLEDGQKLNDFQNKMKPLFLHPGMGKTGTTTLQNSVFRHHTEIGYLGKSAEYRSRVNERGFASNVLAEDLRPLLLNGKRLTQTQKQRAIKNLAEFSNSSPLTKVMLASWESIGDCRPNRFARLLQQLLAINPDFHVLFTIRNPVHWIASAYLQRLKATVMGHRQRYAVPLAIKNISRWYQISRFAWGSDLPLPLINVRTARQLLPKNRVGVVCFEHLRKDPSLFYTKIATFLGVDIKEALSLTHEAHRNRSMTAEQHEFLVYLLNSNSGMLGLKINVVSEEDRAHFRSLNESGNPLAFEVPDAVQQRVKRAAVPECRWLAKEFDLPLEQLGYPVQLRL